MTDESDFSSAIEPKDFDVINRAIESALSAINPKGLEGINTMMENAITSAIDPSVLMGISNLPISDFTRQIYPEFNIPISKSYTQLSYEEQQNFHEQSLKLLVQIRNNTATLSTILELIAENNDKQDVILELVSQMLEIATSMNQVELNNKFEKVLASIKNTLELGDISAKLIFYAYTVFTLVSPLIGK